jgi:lysophospholipase L1-like esterase
MKHLIFLAFVGAMLHAQSTVTITDTIKTPMGGNWSGTVQVTLNNPATAQPLYAGSETLSGWSQTVTVTNGAFSITLYANDTITPTGTSYTARYTPTSGAGWSETWVCPTGATTIRELRSTTVPTPRTMFTPSQITQAGAALNNVLRWNGSNWAPFASILTDPMTTTGDIIYRTGGVPARLPIGSTGQVLTVTGGAPAWATNLAGNAATATALASALTSGRVLIGDGTGIPSASADLTFASGRLSYTTDAQLRFVAEGDSNTEYGWPQTNLATKGFFRRARIINSAVSGSTSVTVASRYASSVTPYAKASNAERAYFALMIGTNDLRLLPSDSAATIYARIAALWAQAAAQGFDVIAFTVMPCVDITSGQETKRVDLNALIRAATGYSHLIDTANIFPSSADTTYFNIDGIHLNEAGRERLAAYLARIVEGNFGGGGLNSVGLIPYVSDVGVLSQASGGELHWDQASKRLRAGGSAGAAGSFLTGPVGGFSGVWLGANTATPTISNYSILTSGSGVVLNAPDGLPLLFRINNGDVGRFYPSTGNFVISSSPADDGSNKLQISGTFLATGGTVRNDAGITSLVVRAGSSQSTNALATFQDSSGTSISSVGSDGGINVPTIFGNVGNSFWFRTSIHKLEFRSDFRLSWSSTTSVFGSQDTFIDRSAEGVLRISGNGTTGGGLVIEALKSSSGTRYVCVDTTGRLTSSATACSGT